MDDDSKQKISSPLDFIYQARDPKKRQIKPVGRHYELLQLAASIEAGDSSDDEEYVPKNMDNMDEDDDEDDDDDDGDDDDEDGEDEDDDSDDADQSNEDEEHDDENHDGGEDDHDDNSLFTKTRNDGDKLIKLTSSPSKLSRSPQSSSHPASPQKSASFSILKICSVCLSDESRGDDEIVECDACGIPVHETCYGIISEDDTQSVHSNVSSESTEPWFCEPCRRGVKSPNCDLCPNTGGIFKETNSGRWVHTACALYTHGVSFADVEKLSGVTLFELNYSSWGAKPCTICEDQRLARSGICIGCDAGLCKTYFHVTCAQKEGLLSESHGADDIDPFIAHCKMHAEKNTMKKKRRACLALQAKLRKIPQGRLYVNTDRTRRKLEKHQSRLRNQSNYSTQRDNETQDFPPIPFKISRMLMSSPSVIKRLSRKSELYGIEPNSAFMSIADEMEAARRKWHIPPGFNLEFVAYVQDRSGRMASMKRRNTDLINQNAQLKNRETHLRSSYEGLKSQVEALRKVRDQLIQQARNKQCLLNDKYGANCQLSASLSDLIQRAPRDVVRTSSDSKVGPGPQSINNNRSTSKKLSKRTPSSKVVPNINQSIENKSHRTEVPQVSVVIPEITNHVCGICNETKDQHLLSLCDSCHLHLHIYCLDPPLARVPKKTKFGGWQCSDCAEKDDEEQEETIMEKMSVVSKDPDVPRRLRDRIIAPDKFADLLFADQNFWSKSAHKKPGKKAKKLKRASNSSGSNHDTINSNTNISINSINSTSRERRSSMNDE